MHDISALTISKATPIQEAVKVIDKGGLGIALVLDEEGVLVGVVTDVDLRKGILAGVPLSAGTEEIMKREPLVGRMNESRQTIIERMQEHSIRQLPVVDEKGRPVGVEHIGTLLKREMRLNKAVIMAGGLGTRLRPLTLSTPKPLLQVGDGPLLGTIVDNFHRHGFGRIYVMVNYLSEQIEEYLSGLDTEVEFVFVHENEPMGTCGALSLLPADEFNEPFVVMNGDILTNINFDHLLDYHQTSRADMTMCAITHTVQVPYGVVDVTGHHVTGLREKPSSTYYINAGIYVLSPGMMRRVPARRYDMTDLIESALAEGLEVNCFPIREFWMDIGQMQDYERAQDAYRHNFA